ncbi:MAG: hypothetical protein EXR21_01755 [Flavobacteriaceae bacterium]|nr:hypothetical protein [Flavobacteriaceae bacterium]
MKRNLILLLLLLLASGGYWLFSKGYFSSKKPELSDFAVADSNSITKIFLADRLGNTVTLERKDEVWMVNGKFEAHRGYLKQLLQTVTKVQVKSPVPKEQFNGVVKDIAAQHVKVEIYQDNELEKTYYVGNSTLDRMGTYMLMDGSSSPFICELTGFEGFLTPRYITNELTWRNKCIFNVPLEKVNSVSLNYTDSPSLGFTLTWSGNTFQLNDGFGKANSWIVDTGMVHYYRGLFAGVYAEAFGTVESSENVDSIRKSKPWCLLTIKSNERTSSLAIYKKGVDIRTKMQYDTQGRPNGFDTERYYAFLNDVNEPMLIQDYVFGNILRRARDFVRK